MAAVHYDLPKPIVERINQVFFPAMVEGVQNRLTFLTHERLQAYTDVREWLTDFNGVLQNRQWKRAFHFLCMLGVQDPESHREDPGSDPTLIWIDYNQATYNGLVGLVLLEATQGWKKQLVSRLAKDIRAHMEGREPEAFAIREHAIWTFEWLKGL